MLLLAVEEGYNKFNVFGIVEELGPEAQTITIYIIFQLSTTNFTHLFLLTGRRNILEGRTTKKRTKFLIGI